MRVRKIKKEGTVNNIYAAYEDKRISILRELGKSSAPEVAKKLNVDLFYVIELEQLLF